MTIKYKNTDKEQQQQLLAHHVPDVTHTSGLVLVQTGLFWAWQQKQNDRNLRRLSEASVSPVEAQVPLPDHVRGVAGLAEPLGQSVHVWRQAARLAGSDDGVLEARVDLISGGNKTDWRLTGPATRLHSLRAPGCLIDNQITQRAATSFEPEPPRTLITVLVPLLRHEFAASGSIKSHLTS